MEKEVKTENAVAPKECCRKHHHDDKHKLDFVIDELLNLKSRVAKFNRNSKDRDVNIGKKLSSQKNFTSNLADMFSEFICRSEMIDVKFMKLDEEAVIPSYATDGSAGLDFTALHKEYDEETQTWLFHTGWAVEIPEGYVGKLYCKSGIYKKTMRLTNAVSIIDSDYRGEICARFENNTSAFMKVVSWFGRKCYRYDGYDCGDMIMQLIVEPCPKVRINIVDKLSETERGQKGFGEVDRKEE